MDKRKIHKIAKKIPKPIRKIIKLFYNPVIVGVYKLDYGECFLDKDRLNFMLSMLKKALKVRGDIIEFGVFRGGSLVQFARFVKKLNLKKNIYGLDTFEGLSKESEYDKILEIYKRSMDEAEFERVKELFKNYPNVHLLKGLVENSIPKIKNKRFCFAYVDLDLYEGTKQALKFLLPRMNKGGIIAIDDYYSKSWIGVKKSVLEFIREEDLITYKETVYYIKK